MDIGAINPSAINAVSQARTGDAVALAVFKKSLDAQQQGAMQLIEAAKVTPAASGGSLGSQIDIKV